MITRPTHSWIAYKPCGCIHDCILDDLARPDKPSPVPAKLDEWLSKGYTIEYVPNSVVVEALELTKCPALKQRLGE